MKKILLLVFLIYGSIDGFSQYLLNTNFEPSSYGFDRARIIELPTQDGFIVSANKWTGVNYYQTGLVMRLDTLGDTLWSMHLDSLEIMDIEVESPSSFLVFGGKYENGSIFKSMLLSIDYSGNILWSKLYNSGIAKSMSRSVSGDIYVVTDQSKLAKLNNSGDTIWVREYIDALPTNYEFFRLFKVQSTNDGGCIVSGNHDWNGIMLEFLIKLDALGNFEWNTEVSVDGTWAVQQIQDIVELSTGDFITSYINSNYSCDLFSFDASGNFQWRKIMYGSGSSLVESIVSYETLSNSIMTCSIGNMSGPEFYPFLNFIEFNFAGDTLSTRTIEKIANVIGRNKLDGFQQANGDHVIVGTGLDYTQPTSVFIVEMDVSGEFYCNEKTNPFNLYNLGNTWPNVPSIDFNPVPQFSISNYNQNQITDSVKIDFACLFPQELCAVSVNLDSLHNEITWEKIHDSIFVSHYNVYKESVVAGVFDLIGSVLSTADGYFMDYSSNPNQVAARYYVTPVQIIGVEGEPGAIHKTILLQANQGVSNDVNLSWSHYEGFSFPTYRIWRGNFTNGFQLIDSVASTLNSYTDNNPPVSDSVYYLEIQLPYSCDPTVKAAVQSSYSNPTSQSGNIGLSEIVAIDKKLVRIIDTMGRETEYKPNTLLIYVYSDGTTEKVYRIK